MKQKLLSLLCSLITFITFSQQIIPETWEVDLWNGADWSNYSVVTYTFNASCYPTQALSQIRNIDTGLLEDNILLTLTYGAGNLEIEGVNQLWTNDTWVNYQKFEHSYSNELIVETNNYDWINDDWQLNNRIIYNYDSSDFLTDTVIQLWNEVNSQWDNFEKREFTYNGDNIATETNLVWNSTNMSWDNYSIEINTYSNSLLISSEYDDWENGQWENDNFKMYTYDGNDFLIETLETDWKDSSMQYEDVSREFYTNNSEGHPTTIISQSWVIASWINTSRLSYTYPECASLANNNFNEEILSIYPNPTKNNINFTLKENTTYTLSTINGQLLQQGSLTKGQNTLNLTSLKSGIYFINLKTETGIITKKIIKQ